MRIVNQLNSSKTEVPALLFLHIGTLGSWFNIQLPT